MSNPFVAEIRIFPFNFPPRGWAFCDGQLLPLSQNTALFSLLGTTYGGNGKSNFALPDMQGNSPMHPGTGNGLTPRSLGEMDGSPTITLLQQEMPLHPHGIAAATTNANSNQPSANVLGSGRFGTPQQGGAVNYYFTGAADTLMSFNAIGPAGNSVPHNNMMPFLTLNFCIALQGVFPARP